MSTESESPNHPPVLLWRQMFVIPIEVVIPIPGMTSEEEKQRLLRREADNLCRKGHSGPVDITVASSNCDHPYEFRKPGGQTSMDHCTLCGNYWWG